MKLQEFVSQTLREIIAGVKEAQKDARTAGAVINPEISGSCKTKSFADVPVDGGLISLPVENIDFDVAVTSTDMTEREAGAGIFVAAFSFGAKEKNDTSNSSINRIKFSVPIALPAQNR